MARHFVMSKCADLEHNGLENSFKSCLKNSLGSQLKICISPKVSPVQVLQCIFRFVGWGEDIAKFCETFLNHDAGPCLVLQKTLQKKKIVFYFASSASGIIDCLFLLHSPGSRNLGSLHFTFFIIKGKVISVAVTV